MKTFLRLLIVISCFFLVADCVGAGEPRTEVREVRVERTTYPFSDPNPILDPKTAHVYPYYRFDGYAEKPVPREWTVVELENEHVKISIYPEIGGKIWSAVVKSTGESFLYDNPVVKFRDVAIRGPWTSGGMEANFGYIGHSPHCSSPVDYTYRKNPDGSASCFIGHLDLVTRSSWTMEINLPADAACFSTRVFWHNGSSFHEPYYSWMNLGLAVTDGWRTINPGTTILGHDGKPASWPIDESGRDISRYKNHAFGSYKSHHVFGKLSDYFGSYDDDAKNGMAGYIPFEDRRGRKMFLWGLSREGMIWKDLLTDPPAGQYAELQTGRLFLQNDESSSATPFKQPDFSPLSLDRWEETWMPVGPIGGFVAASPYGTMNVTRSVRNSGETVHLAVSPVRPMQGTLEILDGRAILHSIPVSLQTQVPFVVDVEFERKIDDLSVRIGGDKLVFRDKNISLTRPVEAPKNFDSDTAFGRYLDGCEKMRRRLYPAAEKSFFESVSKDPGFVPSWNRLAELANRRGDAEEADRFAKISLSVNTYDGEANYQFALAALAMNRPDDAREAASVASISPAWRTVALTTAARIDLMEGRYDSALRTAEKANDVDRFNPEPLRIQAVAYRLSGQDREAEKIREKLERSNPLEHFVNAERFLSGVSFPNGLPNLTTEMPWETYIELAAWYRNVGCEADALRILEWAVLRPGAHNAETLHWIAFLQQSDDLLVRAQAASVEFVFPFRRESLPVFEWAVSRRTPSKRSPNAWKSDYLLALLLNHLGETDRARELLAACGDEADFAPFYALRARWIPERAATDLRKAAALAPDQWRYGVLLARFDKEKKDFEQMLKTTEQYLERFPGNDALEILYAQALLATGRHEEVVRLLSETVILPYEGATEVRSLHQEAALMQAVDELKKSRIDEAKQWIAKARLWPENLGAGKPYSDTYRDVVEDWLESYCDSQYRVLPTPETLPKEIVESGAKQQELFRRVLRRLANP